MSIESMALALHHSQATGTTKLVLVGIANHDGDGGAWPSVRTLARYANVSERSVQRALRELEGLGEIRTSVGAGGGAGMADFERPNRYEFLVRCPDGCDRTSQHRVTSVSSGGSEPGDTGDVEGVTRMSPGDTDVTGGVTPVSPGGVTPVSPEPSLEPSTEPSSSRTSNLVSPEQDRSVENRGADVQPAPTTEGEPSGPPPPAPPPPPDKDPVDHDGHPRHTHHGNALAKCLRLERDRRLPLDPGELLAWCYRLGTGDPWTGAALVDVETSAALDGARDPRAALLARLRAAQPLPAAPVQEPDPVVAPPSRYVDPQATLAPAAVVRAMRAALARTAAVATAG